MSDIGYLGAFLGGVLALLSPCSALLVPSFFAVAFQSPGQVLGRTVVFTVGLMATLVPLGVGSTLVSRIFFEHRGTLVLIAGWAIIALGALQIGGGGFAPKFATEGLAKVDGTSAVSTFFLGSVYGLAGFCSGPILGSVLAIASLSGRAVYGGLLLAVYSVGMAVPLFLLALGWRRWNLGSRTWIRGRSFTVWGRTFHSTSVISGLVFITIGIIFLAFDGTSGLFAPVGTDTEAEAQEWLQRSVSADTDLVVLTAVAVVAGGVAIWRARATGTRSDTSNP